MTISATDEHCLHSIENERGKESSKVIDTKNQYWLINVM